MVLIPVNEYGRFVSAPSLYFPELPLLLANSDAFRPTIILECFVQARVWLTWHAQNFYDRKVGFPSVDILYVCFVEFFRIARISSELAGSKYPLSIFLLCHEALAKLHFLISEGMTLLVTG